MLGLFGIAGWVFVGLIVAAVEKSLGRTDDRDRTIVTAICISGALAGGFIGQMFGWYVFGQPLGFIVSAAAAGLLMSFLYRRPSETAGHQSTPAATDEPAPSTTVPVPPLGLRVVEAIAWGVVAALGAAAAGLVGQVFIGARLYPQRYEQIPSFLLLAPLGAILGFFLGAFARLWRPQWNMARMFAALVAISVGYGLVMFAYARSNAMPPQLILTFDPYVVDAVACDSSACRQSDPPLLWTVRGSVHVREIGVAGDVDAIVVTSYPDPLEVPRTNSLEEVLDIKRFWGPKVRLTGRDIAGSRHIRPNEVVTFPLDYSYASRDGRSTRDIDVSIEFTDISGQHKIHAARWKVR